MVREVNHTFITLVPKLQGTERIEDFCPISCINSLYKIHAKLIVDILGEVVPSLTYGNQATFTSSRFIGEQIKLAREMTNGFNCKSTPCRFCMTIDLCKAFDTISWSVIDNTLIGMGFSDDFQQIINQCYLTPSYFHSMWRWAHSYVQELETSSTVWSHFPYPVQPSYGKP